MTEETFRDLFVRHICAALEKQFYVLDMLGERKHQGNVDLNRVNSTSRSLADFSGGASVSSIGPSRWVLNPT